MSAKRTMSGWKPRDRRAASPTSRWRTTRPGSTNDEGAFATELSFASCRRARDPAMAFPASRRAFLEVSKNSRRKKTRSPVGRREPFASRVSESFTRLSEPLLGPRLVSRHLATESVANGAKLESAARLTARRSLVRGRPAATSCRTDLPKLRTSVGVRARSATRRPGACCDHTAHRGAGSTRSTSSSTLMKRAVRSSPRRTSKSSRVRHSTPSTAGRRWWATLDSNQ